MTRRALRHLVSLVFALCALPALAENGTPRPPSIASVGVTATGAVVVLLPQPGIKLGTDQHWEQSVTAVPVDGNGTVVMGRRSMGGQVTVPNLQPSTTYTLFAHTLLCNLTNDVLATSADSVPINIRTTAPLLGSTAAIIAATQAAGGSVTVTVLPPVTGTLALQTTVFASTAGGQAAKQVLPSSSGRQQVASLRLAPASNWTIGARGMQVAGRPATLRAQPTAVFAANLTLAPEAPSIRGFSGPAAAPLVALALPPQTYVSAIVAFPLGNGRAIEAATTLDLVQLPALAPGSTWVVFATVSDTQGRISNVSPGYLLQAPAAR